MDFEPDRPEIQVGSLAEIFLNNYIVGTFKVTDIQYQPDNILIYLIQDDYQKVPTILNILPRGNYISRLPPRPYPVKDELSITFLKPLEFEELIEGLVVNNDVKLRSVKENLRKFLVGYGNELLLNNLGIEELPKKYFSHPGIINNLQELSLSNNRLTSLPEIGNLHNLKKLYLWNNKLTLLPDEIGNLYNLNELYLSDNELKSLPEEIGNLHNLKKLYLSNNKLTSLPEEIGNLENLQELDLSDNKLTSLPEEIGNLHNVKALNLSGNKLKFLPGEIGNLQELKRLYLRNNLLTSIPISMGNLQDLEELDLNNNPLNVGTPKTIEVLRQRYQELSRGIKSARKR